MAERDLRDGEARVCDVRDGDRLWSFLLVRVKDRVAVYENICPHARFPLERFDGGVTMQSVGDALAIVCAAHGASFDAASGRCLGSPGAARPLRAVDVEQRDGVICLRSTG